MWTWGFWCLAALTGGRVRDKPTGHGGSPGQPVCEPLASG